MATQNTATAVAFKVTVKNDEIPMDRIVGWLVEQDLGQPGMCSITLRNEDHSYSVKYKPGDEVFIKAGDDDTDVFFGELACMEPTYKANGENIVMLRAFDRLHRLTRGRKSKTFTSVTDEKIVTRIVNGTGGDTSTGGETGNQTDNKADYGLTVKCGRDAAQTTYDHVYQHNQTDLEFLRVRAARLGYDVWVQGKELYFDKPDSGKDSGITLRYGDAATAEANSKKGKTVYLKRFTPKLSTARLLSEVEVRGWDPVKKEEVIGKVKATEMPSRLGKTQAFAAAGSMCEDVKKFEVDHPVHSVDEARKLAMAKLAEANMSYMTGDGECRGTPEIRPGVVVTIIVNPDKENDRFNGKYLVVGATHRYSSTSIGDMAGYVTSLRVSRDGEGPIPSQAKD